MDDKRIVDLYFSRNEEAIIQTDKKYGHYCYCIAYSILANREDAEESVSDTYMTAWRQIPPRRPAVLSTFLGKITRHISIVGVAGSGVKPPENVIQFQSAGKFHWDLLPRDLKKIG